MENNTNRPSQHYIGTPTGAVLCVEQADGEVVTASYWHGYSREAIPIRSLAQMMFGLEALYNMVGFPQAATNERLFHESSRNLAAGMSGERVLTDADLLAKSGQFATFIIRVFQRQNSTWQGSVTWVEKNQSLLFNSVIELIHQIMDALHKNSGDGKEGEADPNE